MKDDLSQERLHELLDYDPETGVFKWAKSRPGVRQGATAGSVSKKLGYIVIGVDRENYFAHRLAWLWMTGSFPSEEIDHRDGVRTNNRFSNLRSANKSENAQNRKQMVSNKSGLTGVCWDSVNLKWLAQIMIDGQSFSLGRYTDKQDAHCAYLLAKSKLHLFQPTLRDDFPRPVAVGGKREWIESEIAAWEAQRVEARI